MDVHKYFSQPVIIEMKRQIQTAGGNEVFFTGIINASGIVTSVKTCARGTSDEVPVHQTEVKECSVLIHNHPGGCLEPSDADMAVASDASGRAQGFYIINNDATDVYVVMEPVKPKEIKKLNLDDTALYLENGGPLSVQSSAYEERPVQIDLLRKIAESFNKNALGVFEAGTGVGKSYAYLIPAMLWAVENRERVIISTGTINLQQQLCEKDIPAAEKIIGRKIKSVLVKGRQNYVCLRRLQDAGNERELFGEDTGMFDSITDWAKTSQTGSKSDLAFMPPESVWSRIKSESDACMGARCPFHSVCFVMKVRREASDAQLIIVNHHLLFADIESRMNGAGYDDQAVLPPYRRIVFDEAHGIENAATSFFSESVNRFALLKQVNLMYRHRKNYEAGYIPSLAILSSNEDKAVESYIIVNRIKKTVSDLETASQDLMKDVGATIRLCDATVRDFGPVLSLTATLAQTVSEFTSLVKEIMQGIADDDKTAGAYWEARLVVRRLDNAVLLLHDFASWDEKRELVFWLQRKYLSKDAPSAKDDDDRAYTVFTKTPLDIAPLMSTGVFEPMESVVCTSATLEINHDFGWWMRRSGVAFAEESRLLFGDFPSPFPYKKNLLFAVPKDAPFPENGMEFQAYIESAIARLITAAQGRTLVLFTSYDMLRSAFRGVKLQLKEFDGILIKQGDDDNSRLLDMFREDTTSVLFATDSFWQGVDVPGESLSQVIIVKLPFTVPNDPVFTARAEAVTLRGGNSFMELSVPEAVIKFRQGFGRLIRRSDDRGCVIVLDRRIYEKRYGQIFINSIPETKRSYEKLDDIVKQVEQFLFDR
ncbi:MAG: DEAD/DEAH box helicase family protein [Treponema sp.]|nr:DEAD/DEAH box helicase family protein [Treponema sp.]